MADNIIRVFGHTNPDTDSISCAITKRKTHHPDHWREKYLPPSEQSKSPGSNYTGRQSAIFFHSSSDSGYAENHPPFSAGNRLNTRDSSFLCCPSYQDFGRRPAHCHGDSARHPRFHASLYLQYAVLSS